MFYSRPASGMVFTKPRLAGPSGIIIQQDRRFGNTFGNGFEIAVQLDITDCTFLSWVLYLIFILALYEIPGSCLQTSPMQPPDHLLKKGIMSLPTLRQLALATAIAGLLQGGVSAAPINPASYSFDQPTDCGTWCYNDPAFTKLTDGVLGKAGWAVNDGQEWAGWAYDRTVNVDFDFGTRRLIDTVRVGSTQDTHGDVMLPSITLFSSDDSATWSQILSLSVAVTPANGVDPNSSADNMAPRVSKGACIRIASRGSALTASSKARVPGRTFIANSHCQLRV